MVGPEDAVSSATGSAESDFRVLVVCTGNLCRSPVAEHLLGDAVRRRGHAWTVTSAGLAAEDGFEMHPNAVEFLSACQLEVPPTWASRALTRADIESADLVLTATRGQAEAVVGIMPSAIMRVFPLQQFARLVSSSTVGFDKPVETGRDLLSTANMARTRVATVDPGQDDIQDPLRRSRRYFRRRMREIDQATESIADRLITRVVEESEPVTSG